MKTHFFFPSRQVHGKCVIYGDTSGITSSPLLPLRRRKGSGREETAGARRVERVHGDRKEKKDQRRGRVKPRGEGWKRGKREGKVEWCGVWEGKPRGSRVHIRGGEGDRKRWWMNGRVTWYTPHQYQHTEGDLSRRIQVSDRAKDLKYLCSEGEETRMKMDAAKREANGKTRTAKRNTTLNGKIWLEYIQEGDKWPIMQMIPNWLSIPLH